MKDELIGFSPSMRQVIGAAVDVASAPTTVLLTGETGSGKEVLARFIHQMSPRASLPLTVLSGQSLDLEQVEAALRHGGTVVLDEIAAIAMDTQGRLLALLEGQHASRVIATSHRDLRELVERGQLRSDLFYRLDVYPIVLPPLRERREDIAALADVLLARVAVTLGRAPLKLTGEALGLLETQRWPGNVRELANVLALAARATARDEIGRDALPVRFSNETSADDFRGAMQSAERELLLETLGRTRWNVTAAAARLGMPRRTIVHRMAKLGLKRPAR